MENLSDNEQKELFLSLLAEPEKAGTVPVEKLEKLVKTYPQMSILRTLLARAYKDNYPSNFDQKLRNASVYSPDRAVLYKIINHPDRLNHVNESQVFVPAGIALEEAVAEIESPDMDVLLEEEHLNIDERPAETIDELEVGTMIAPEPDEENTSAEDAEDSVDEFDEDKYLDVIESQIPKYTDDDSYPPTVVEDEADEEDYNSAIEEETSIGADDSEEEPETAAGKTEIDDEVFDEITGIDDIAFAPSPFKLIVEDGVIPRDEDELAQQDDEDDTGLVLHESIITEEDEELAPWEVEHKDDEPEIVEQPVAEKDIDELPPWEIEDDEQEVVEEPAVEEAELEITATTPSQAQHHVETNPQHNFYADEERLILGNIAGSDYFSFNDKFPATEEVKAEDKQPEPAPVAARLENKFKAEDERVSKYHDDKMPYSFMWWLDKTRREHAGLYQPYAPYKQVTPKAMQPVATDSPSELQKQYYENIFHLTTIENLDKAKAEFNSGKKEDVIIERFIKEEPQIRPPSNDKLDNENKAKKSAEDQDELVTETLARIYLDQMLYHKAITTYKKLLLKFPEKSSYFVAQIELLERKIN